jgi:glycosyltransferase involved in cell wall biosynthesis
MKKPISVIITCYNLENYIGEAIESVLKQNYCGPVEIVVIDDGSMDRSAEIIRSYRTVRYLRSDRNLGVLMATVLGLMSTTGEIIFFLDGDDLWDTDKLSAVVEKFMSNPELALVTHNLEYIDGSGQVLGRLTQPDRVMAAIQPSDEDRMIRNGILLHKNYVWLGSAYAVHRWRGDIKGFCAFTSELSDPLNTYQDWPLAFWVTCQKNTSVGYLHRKLFQYRLHGANHSGDASSPTKAMRNVRRAQNTAQALVAMADRFEVEPNVRRANRKVLRFYTYLDDLYGGHKWHAAVGFLACLPYVMTNNLSLGKEVVRFIGGQLLGVENFVALSRTCKSLINSLRV